MSAIITIGSSVSGSVSHHAGHMIGKNPCSGHSVSGSQQSGNQKFKVSGRAVATVGDNGNTSCPCCGQGFMNTEGSSKFFVSGKAVVRSGDSVNIHGAGSGTLGSGISKFIVR